MSHRRRECAAQSAEQAPISRLHSGCAAPPQRIRRLSRRRASAARFSTRLAMTLPEHIWFAAREGDLDTIRAYFEDDSDGARDVDDVFENINNLTPLIQCARGNDLRHLTLEHVEVARYLLSRGASIDEKGEEGGQTALLIACYTSFGTVTEMVSLLLSAGADPNTRNNFGRTPLNAHVMFCQTPSVECVTALLRAGASLDRVLVNHGHEYAFEEALSRILMMNLRHGKYSGPP